MRRHRGTCARGFTIIELMVVVAIIGLLAAIAVPKYLRTLQKAKESRLKSDLSVMRNLIQQYKVDKKKYPESLAALVEGGYLRVLPKEPVNESDAVCSEPSPGCAWVEVHNVPEDPDDPNADTGVEDVKSGVPGNDSDGAPFGDY